MAILVVIQNDLRLHDNPALYNAIAKKEPVIVAYLDHTNLGNASIWWRNKSFDIFKQNLGRYKIPLLFIKEDLESFIIRLKNSINITAIYSNDLSLNLKEYTPLHKIFSANLIFDPLIKKSFKIFRPFWRYLNINYTPTYPLIIPKFTELNQPKCDLSAFSFAPTSYSSKQINYFEQIYQPGEDQALLKLREVKNSIRTNCYFNPNDLNLNIISELALYIRFGDISVKQIWHELWDNSILDSITCGYFLSHLGWREFAYHLMSHYPRMQTLPLKEKYVDYSPELDKEIFKIWQTGKTGYPIIDAGIRQLKQTGWISNRIQMLTGCFFTKNLLQPWQIGQQWFYDHLIDADPAINAMNWQWVSGCGTDTTPYIRIFNPLTQAKLYDPEGEYVKEWVNELTIYDKKQIHQSFLKSRDFFKESGYPPPIIDLQESRQITLNVYRNIGNTTKSLIL